MGHRNLEELLGAVGSPVDFLRNQQVGPNVYPGVKAEYSNWRNGQSAWPKTGALRSVLPHGRDLGGRAGNHESLSRPAPNSFKDFASTGPSSSRR